jgi:pyruvate kinase
VQPVRNVERAAVEKSYLVERFRPEVVVLKRAKIVCTIGPASSDRETLRRLIDAGMDVARMNFSHGTHEDHKRLYETVRGLDDRITILQDLQGPKLRIGEIAGGEISLSDGERVTLTTRSISGTREIIQVSYPELPGDVSPGDDIYIADGIVHLVVEKVQGEDVLCRIIHGGLLTSRKGINLPGVRMSTPALTVKDRADLDFGVDLGVDFVALSFVRNAGEVRELKKMLGAKDSTALVIAKIEKREALDNLHEILVAADGLMIARGDLGVEIPTEEVPIAQKWIVSECVRRAKPVITATQMLESMVATERPTRAEASDVANAALDGSDALMLSAETATGRYPVESVRIMDRIIRRVEEYEGENTGAYDRKAHVFRSESEHPDISVMIREGMLVDAVSAGAVKVADEVSAAAVACLTHTGRTARMIASYRPGVPIIALTDFVPAARHLGLVWGVRAIPVECIDTTETIFAVIQEKVRELGISGKVVLTAGIPTKARGPTNTIHVVEV